MHRARHLAAPAGAWLHLRASQRARGPRRRDAGADTVAGDPARVAGRVDLPGRTRSPAGGGHGWSREEAVPLSRGMASSTRPAEVRPSAAARPGPARDEEGV